MTALRVHLPDELPTLSPIFMLRGCAPDLLDHLIRPQQQRRPDGEPERLCGFHADEIDDELFHISVFLSETYLSQPLELLLV